MIYCVIGTEQGSEIVLSNGKRHWSRKQSSDVMELICREYAVDFNGSRRVCADLLQIRQKPPVCLSLTHHTLFFPTTGIDNVQCDWINYEHIRSIKERGKDRTKIVFRNGTSRTVSASFRVVKRQINRCDVLSKRNIELWKI
ncbi:hypothetical protein G7062_08550 [Erysipelothrix sp. HDW6C]|uniref:competence protein ComK n=1 Tax=Erysipelothrix sp. HDW6C TaxID=2714930 RepID=UPI00140A907E|nr:hypothetical protein G7062_08550 [Erysipelothrix sp. HDW6C]